MEPRSREGENNSNHKIAEVQALEIWKRLQSGQKAPKCAEEFGVSVHIVRSIKYGKRWTHVTGLENKRKRRSEGPSAGNSPMSLSPSSQSISLPIQSPASPSSTETPRPKKRRSLLMETGSPHPIHWMSTANEKEITVVELLTTRFASSPSPPPRTIQAIRPVLCN